MEDEDEDEDCGHAFISGTLGLTGWMTRLPPDLRLKTFRFMPSATPCKTRRGD